RRHIADFAAALREGRIAGHDGRRFTDVVAIGGDGSHLGPALAVDALAVDALAVDALAVDALGAATLSKATPGIHFVSNLDGGEIAARLAGLDPATTLVIVVSKSFAAADTMAEVEQARRWFLAGGTPESALAQHFIAVSADRAAVARFGLDPERGF